MATNNGSSGADEGSEGTMPILLLKTKSTPSDGYEELFNAALDFEPTFVPVMEHTFENAGMETARVLVQRREIGREGRYGGLVFTSQRAVEAFAKIVAEVPDPDAKWPHLQDIPIYTVGPATERALRAIPQTPPLQIFGAEAGNGEALAKFILHHYHAFYSYSSTADPPSPSVPSTSQSPSSTTTPPPPLLFLVGESRRDIIPLTLTSPSLPQSSRIPITELVLYATTLHPSFTTLFSFHLHSTASAPLRWVVVFSPIGCEEMLRALDLLDETTGRVRVGERGGGCGVRTGRRSTYVVTIGRTTRDVLRKGWGFEPDVCAERPSPEGVKEGIERFMEKVGRREEGAWGLDI